jgi:hypothetical protein
VETNDGPVAYRFEYAAGGGGVCTITDTATATTTKSQPAHFDFLSATGSLFDPAGGEDYLTWSDPYKAADVGLGRLFAFDVIKSKDDVSTNLEVYCVFSGAPNTTQLWTMAISKNIIGIKYEREQPVETRILSQY